MSRGNVPINPGLTKKSLKGQKLAFGIVKRRRRLRPYLVLMNAGYVFTPEQAEYVQKLATEIEQDISKLEELGFDVEESIATAPKDSRSWEPRGKKKKKRKKFKTKRRHGGVGVYGRGAGVKIWR